LTAPMTPIGPGRTMNIGSPGWLTQVQHKGNRVEVVDHADHDGMPVHIVTRIGKDGRIRTDIR